MDGTPGILSSPHPPTEVTIHVDASTSGTISISPLNSAPNTPERKRPPSPMTPPPNLGDTDDPAIFYPTYNNSLSSRHTAKQHESLVATKLQGRESRKSRIKAAQAARRPIFEEKKTEDIRSDRSTASEALRRIPSLYINGPHDASYNTVEDIPMDEQQQEEIVMGSRLSVTSDGVEVNRQRSDAVLPVAYDGQYFPSFDEEDAQPHHEIDSQAPSIDEAASPMAVLSEAGRRAAMEQESRWDRFERGRSMERMTTAPVVPRRPSSSLSPARLVERSTPETRNYSPLRSERKARVDQRTAAAVKPTTRRTALDTTPKRGSKVVRTSERISTRQKMAESRLTMKSPVRRNKDDDRSSLQTGEGMNRATRRTETTQQEGVSPKRPIDLTKFADTARVSASDDVSSSDETPLVKNSQSNFRDRQSLRKVEKQNQLRSMYGAARQQKVNPPNVALDSTLPPLMVDHSQLQTIGVKALMSVCDGIGSLFVTEKQIKASPEQTIPTVLPHKHKKRSTRRDRTASTSKQRASSKQPPTVRKIRADMDVQEADATPTTTTTATEWSPSKEHDKVKIKALVEADEDSDGDIPPPPPIVEEPNELDNSLLESESNTDAGTETSYSTSTDARENASAIATELRDGEEGEHEEESEEEQEEEDQQDESSLSTIAGPTSSVSTSSTPDSHEIGPTAKKHSSSKGLNLSHCQEEEPKLIALEPIERNLLNTTVIEEEDDKSQEPVDQPKRPQMEPTGLEEFQESSDRRLDMYIDRIEGDASASVASRDSVQSQVSAEWSLASAIKNQATRDCPSYHSLSEHKKSDPEGDKGSPFAGNSKNTTSSLTNTEKESSFDISEPPTLRRLNGSIDSIVPEFSTKEIAANGKGDWPDAFSDSQAIPSDEGSNDPSMTLSPMSEFLAERLRDGRNHVKPLVQPGSEHDGFFDDVSKCPENLGCRSISSELQIDCNSFENHDNTEERSIDPVPSSRFVESNLDQQIYPIHEQQSDGDSLVKPSLQSPSRSNSDTTTDLFNSLDQMVHDLQSLASGRYDSGDSQSTTVPTFADALQVDTEPSSQDSVDTDIRRDFLPPNAGYEGLPYLISSINSDPGIAKGDIMISLLNNDSCRVKDAVSRCRLMRRYSDVDWLEKKATRRQPGHSVLFNVDENQEAGGINDVAHLEQALLQSLKYDDFDKALELCSDINQKYNEYESNLQDDVELLEKFQLYKATALFNLGVVHLLRGDIDEALMSHEAAVELQTGSKDVTDSEYATLLNKSAACRLAAGDYVTAFTEMEEALLLAREELRSLDDYRQLAEILNNLGCLSYIGGKVDRAAMYFDESLLVHEKVTSKSMYLGSRFSSHAAILNASITKANLGFLLLVTQKPAESVVKLEESLRDQEILLFGAHVTIISTMDHLIVANLLSGRKKSASEMLRKAYTILAEAFGHDSEQCAAAKRKIFALEMKDGAADVSAKTAEAPKNDIGETKSNFEGVSAKPKSKRKTTRKSSRTRYKLNTSGYQQAEC